MTRGRALADNLVTLDSVDVAVLTDDVSDNYVSKTRFAVSEFANVVLRGASVISGEALLCANLGFGLRLVSNAGGQRHTMLFDTGPEAAIFIRNCTALGVGFGEIEAIAITTDTGITWPRSRRRSTGSSSRAGEWPSTSIPECSTSAPSA